MNQELKLRIGGVGISLKWGGSKIIDWPHPHYQHFIYEGKTQVNLRIHCDNLPQYPQDELIFDAEEEGYWKLYQNSSGYVVETYDTLTPKKNKVCFIDSHFSSGDVYVNSQSDKLHQPSQMRSKYPVWSLPSLMQPLGQLLLVNVLAKGGGIMVHGLGIDDRGKGIAFLGGSGTGKSTLARFWKDEDGVSILSDEHIIVRKENGKFWLYGTPWPGMAMAASSKRVPLDEIFFIEHSLQNKIVGQATMTEPLTLLYLVFWDKERLSSVLKTSEELIKNIDCRKLGFVKDKSAVEFVRQKSK